MSRYSLHQTNEREWYGAWLAQQLEAVAAAATRTAADIDGLAAKSATAGPDVSYLALALRALDELQSLVHSRSLRLLISTAAEADAYADRERVPGGAR